jgi:hypothetical protein
MGRREIHTVILLANVTQREHLQDLDFGEDIIKTNIKEIGWEGLGCVHIAQWRGPVTVGHKLPGSLNFWKFPQ